MCLVWFVCLVGWFVSSFVSFVVVLLFGLVSLFRFGLFVYFGFVGLFRLVGLVSLDGLVGLLFGWLDECVVWLDWIGWMV